MYRFAIVEDNQQDEERLVEQLQVFFQDKTSFTIEYFKDGPSFLEKSDFSYHLIFLDVEMKPMTGFEVASKIRERNQSAMLIFVTNMSQLARQGYKYAAIDYLIKPVEQEELNMTLNRALTQIQSGEERIILLPGKEKEKISVSIGDITYIDVNGHYITFHTLKGEYEQYGVFKKILQEINLPNFFVKCNQCFVVNMHYIEKVYTDSLVVKGVMLAISRSHKKRFANEYSAFISGRRF